MKRLILLILVLFLAGCSSTRVYPFRTPAAGGMPLGTLSPVQQQYRAQGDDLATQQAQIEQERAAAAPVRPDYTPVMWAVGLLVLAAIGLAVAVAIMGVTIKQAAAIIGGLCIVAGLVIILVVM
jgi:hypothetical protein